jgi:hypothetical protein
MTSFYEQIIRETLAKIGRVGAADARHVEAWMRIEHSTLDCLSADQFRAEVKIALECIEAGPLADSESLAQSYGL